MSVEDDFERYLQSHIHPNAQPAARRLTHHTVGKISMESFMEVADVLQASHEAFDDDMEQQGTLIDASNRFGIRM